MLRPYILVLQSIASTLAVNDRPYNLVLQSIVSTLAVNDRPYIFLFYFASTILQIKIAASLEAAMKM